MDANWTEPEEMKKEAEAVPWTSKTVDGAWPIPMKKPALLICQLESKVEVSVKSVKSRESAATVAESVTQENWPAEYWSF